MQLSQMILNIYILVKKMPRQFWKKVLKLTLQESKTYYIKLRHCEWDRNRQWSRTDSPGKVAYMYEKLTADTADPWKRHELVNGTGAVSAIQKRNQKSLSLYSTLYKN